MSDDTTGSESLTAGQFHASPGVADWRVTATGPQAVFVADSLAQAAGLVGPVLAASEEFGIQPDIDLRPGGIVVRLPQPSIDGIPARAGEFAAAISRAAVDQGLRADPSRVQTIQVYVAEHSEADVRPFFRAALGYQDLGDTDAVDPLRRGPDLAFNPIDGDVPRRGRTHLDIFVPADQARARVDAALAAGGRLVDDSHAPAWWTLASPDNHGIDIASWPDTYSG
jgi:4a-hydroxytetrahydrobiopterin dehydratase